MSQDPEDPQDPQQQQQQQPQSDYVNLNLNPNDDDSFSNSSHVVITNDDNYNMELCSDDMPSRR